ncbi:hypothetical protein ACP70R_012621 [Stipagrostis hirtigluma subsp. patula]
MSYSRGSRYESPSPYRRSSRSRYRSRSRSVESSDAENPGNNLYVTGLSVRVTDRDLEKHFSTEGEVIDASVVLDPWTRESRGFGFVTMATVKEADRCIKYLDRSVLEGRVITVEKDLADSNRVDVGSSSASNSYNLTPKHATSTKGLQKEDVVVRRHLGNILAQNHHVDVGLPEATHLFGGTVTIHATHLIVNDLIPLMVETDHTPHMIGEDHTPLMIEGDHTLPMTGADHTHPMIGVGHIHLTMAVGTAQDLHTVTATAQDLHTATEDGGHIHMTVLYLHTTAGATDLFPDHQVLLQGPGDGAILAVCHLGGAILAAAPQNQKDQQALLPRKVTVGGNRHAAGLQASGVVQGKATHTAAVHTQE